MRKFTSRIFSDALTKQTKDRQCCQGIDSTYNVRVGRSDSLSGPYMDQAGVPMTEGGGTLILSAYGQWMGPGHSGMLIEDGVYWMVYHAYDSKQIGIPKLRSSQSHGMLRVGPHFPARRSNGFLVNGIGDK